MFRRHWNLPPALEAVGLMTLIVLLPYLALILAIGIAAFIASR